MRSIAIAPEAEFRSTDKGHHFTGYASVFDVLTEPFGKAGLRELVRTSAFQRDLARPNRKTLVVDHDDRRLLASTTSGHLTLAPDSRGLLTEADLPDTATAREVRELHERGETSGMSFEFSPNKGGAPIVDGVRELRDVRLFHVSILQGLTPAYPATTAEIRSLALAVEAEAEDVAAVIEALTEQRRLDVNEWSLMERLLIAVHPEQAEIRAAVPLLTPNLDAARALIGAR